MNYIWHLLIPRLMIGSSLLFLAFMHFIICYLSILCLLLFDIWLFIYIYIQLYSYIYSYIYMILQFYMIICDYVYNIIYIYIYIQSIWNKWIRCKYIRYIRIYKVGLIICLYDSMIVCQDASILCYSVVALLFVFIFYDILFDVRLHL